MDLYYFEKSCITMCYKECADKVNMNMKMNMNMNMNMNT